MESLDPTLAIILAASFGYVLGSIPWGLVLVRITGGGDIRDVGSGNIGATNVLRTGNKFAAFLTLILDASKGGFAAWLFMNASVEAGLIAGFAAVVGHNFPVWLKFKGGKGVATSLGTLLVISWPVGVLSCAVWLLVAGMFRFSSLASMASIAASPFIAYWFDGNIMLVYMAGGLTVLSLVRHKPNIQRLIKGQETKIGQKKED